MANALRSIASLPEEGRYRPDNAASFLDFFRWYAAETQDAPAWLREIRRVAAESLECRGIPTPRLERWRYTNLLPAVKDYGDGMSVSDRAVRGPGKLVQKFGDVLSAAPEWLASLLAERDEGVFRYGDMMLWDLNAMFLRDGLVVDVPAHGIAENPVVLTATGKDGGFYSPRTVVRLGAGAELTLIEHDAGTGAYWDNRTIQIIVGPGATLRHYRIQDGGAQAVSTQTAHVRIARDGSYEAFTLTAGTGFSRNQSHVQLTGENAACGIFGINILRGSQHSDMTVEVEHMAPRCRSVQMVRSVLDGQTHGVFQGKVYVHGGAVRTDARQLSNALLLCEGAEMDTKPELEIHADDVACSHGATTGKLDNDALFYMRSRGVPEDEARGLLIAAFVGEVVDKIGDEAVREGVKDRVAAWLLTLPPSHEMGGGIQGGGPL